MLAFNYFFLPPVGTFTIADPQNWVALFAFLAASLIASQLGTRVRREAEEAQRRRHEMERLYTFSQQLLVSGNVIALLNAIPNHIVETFGVGAAALYLDYKQKFYHSGAARPLPRRGDEDRPRARRTLATPSAAFASCPCAWVARRRQPGHLGTAAFARRPSRPWARSSPCPRTRARRRGARQDEASREGERLKSALLDSVTHDFRTPLTSIKASVTSLLFAARKPTPPDSANCSPSSTKSATA